MAITTKVVAAVVATGEASRIVGAMAEVVEVAEVMYAISHSPPFLDGDSLCKVPCGAELKSTTRGPAVATLTIFILTRTEF